MKDNRMTTLLEVTPNMMLVQEAAASIPCCVATVLKYVKKKMLKGQKIDGRWYVDRVDLVRAKAEQLFGDTHAPETIAAKGGVRTVTLQLPEGDFILVERLLQMRKQRVEDLLVNAFFYHRDRLTEVVSTALKSTA